MHQVIIHTIVASDNDSFISLIAFIIKNAAAHEQFH